MSTEHLPEAPLAAVSGEGPPPREVIDLQGPTQGLGKFLLEEVDLKSTPGHRVHGEGGRYPTGVPSPC